MIRSAGLPISAALLMFCVGTEAAAAVGGPDSFGYRFVDQDDGAVYNYVDITATGTVVVAGDNLTATFMLGAPFDVYGTTYDDLVVATNGFLTSDETAAGDASNDCPLPSSPSTGAGFRVNVLHDNLDTTVYYEYFDAVAAAGLGYPGQAAGISVVQWSGVHSASATPVDVEAVLFHDDGSILTMVSLDGELGSGSTLGIQDDGATTGLTYACNTVDSVGEGTTAVLYTPGPAPDSDCCTASPTGAGGCTNTLCQDYVCDIDDACCQGDWDPFCADVAASGCAVLCGGLLPTLRINEIRVDQPGADVDEYFEIAGPPGTPLTDVQYVVLGDTPTGEIEAVIDLSGNVIPASGYFVAAEGTFTLGTPDLSAFINFENADTVTHMLVGGLSASISDNLDVNGDGVLDSQPWNVVFDTVALVDPVSVDLPYGPPFACTASETCQEVGDGIDAPFQVARCPNVVGTFFIGNDDVATLPSTDTPGQLNVCQCGDGNVDPGESCDTMGESATCDVDCTAVMCGDGLVNVSAGEDCEGGESAFCDGDCTAAACGDGLTNMTAGEACDDGGESATCDVDCSPAVCGDGLTNMTAGEDCDDVGESAQCDADCTVAMCGDGVTNVTAGEVCDDGGESDVCDDDCTPALCGDGLTNVSAGEACDDGGESATCNDDCSVATCGDMIVNATAGETCDDGGRTATCDADCTAVSCGDGLVNATAGEECDGDGMGAGGETATCDDDCTAAMCGDMLVNATAGETCDDGAESETCDDDCTEATCGDGTHNATAGEECDDGNTDDGDGCASDCTEEEDVGTTGTDGGSSDDGADTTTGGTPGTDDGSTGSLDESGDEGPGSTSGPMPVTTADGDSTGETDGDTAGGVSGDDGCNCSTRAGNGGGAWWGLILLGLGIRRRPRATGRRRDSAG